jgi:hypothetical protein
MMIRIDKDTVELTAQEREANNYFNQMLDSGFGVEEAADAVALQYRGTQECGQIGCKDCNLPPIDPAFIAYLKEP